MSTYITIDGGTTNTRFRLVKDYLVVAESGLSLGAKDCTDGNEIYKKLIKEKTPKTAGTVPVAAANFIFSQG